MYSFTPSPLLCQLHFFFTAPAPPEIYTLSLHDALPISFIQANASAIHQYGGPTALATIGTGLPYASAWKDRKSTRLNSSHRCISYAVFCLKKKTTHIKTLTICLTVDR